MRFIYPVLIILSIGLLCTKIAVAGDKPVVLNCSESAGPGDVIGIQGDSFGMHPQVWMAVVMAGDEKLQPQRRLTLLDSSSTYISARIPADTRAGLYAIWVDNGRDKSAPRFVNRARIMFSEFDTLRPAAVFRLFGRNLDLEGAGSQVRFVAARGGGEQLAAIVAAGPYQLKVQAPGNLLPGTSYQLYVSNGAGGRWGETLIPSTYIEKPAPFIFGADIPWTADFDFTTNLYNVKNDPRLKRHALGDGQENDRAAIQQAIDEAAEDGGGVVFLPEGVYKLVYDAGCGITMRSRVLLKGAGMDKTILRYGYGKPFTTERVKASYGWTLGWPDSRVEGMGLVWHGGITTSGLADLSLVNINESGDFVHTIKNMPEGGSQIILKDCRFDVSNGWGLAMVNIDKLLITGCEFKSSALQVRGINAPTRTWPWDLKNSHHVLFRNNKSYYYAGRFGANGCHHAVFENNLFVRDGNHQSKGETGGLSLDYVTDIVVQANTFAVTGKPVPVRNQGETILSQGGMAHQQTLGRVTAATSTTLSDGRQEWQDFTDRVSTDWQYVIHPSNYSIAIVDGKGAGQWRTITGNNDTSLTIERPWEVTPAPGSKYVITQWSACRMLINNNVLKDNNRGIWIYSGGTDLVIAGNKLINSEGIYIRSDQRISNNRYNIAWNMLVAGNIISDSNGLRPAYIAAWLAQVKADKLFGAGILGLEVRRNLLQAFTPNVSHGWIKGEGFFNYVFDEQAKTASSDTVTAGIWGTIFQANRAIATERAYTWGSGAKHTVITDTTGKFSQQAAELAALKKYEASHPPPSRLPPPAPPDSDSLGARLVRTAGLLALSTAQRRQPVKILIYGQSITGSQVFTEYLQQYLEEKFPYADLTLENRCIGGFAASQIVRTAPHDVYNTCADMLIFHVYGGEKTGELEEFFANVRRNTTAEILLMNHHLNANQKRPDENARRYLQYIADKYSCELVDISTEWVRYLSDNHLQPADLLRDNVHPNRQGNWLLVQLIGRHIQYDTSFKPSEPLVQTIYPDKEHPGRITFFGTRIDAVASAATLKTAEGSTTRVLVDGKPVAENNQRYVITRPGPGPGTWWPAIRRVSHRQPLIEEDWTLEVTAVNADTTMYAYKVYGSVTGYDGSGTSTAAFTSNSGRVVIDPADILFIKIKEVFKSATLVGFKVSWSVVPLYSGIYQPQAVTDPAKLYKTNLVRGLVNGPHTLELVPCGKSCPGIDYFEVHRPAAL
jgi:hypothetical protein